MRASLGIAVLALAVASALAVRFLDEALETEAAA